MINLFKFYLKKRLNVLIALVVSVSMFIFLSVNTSNYIYFTRDYATEKLNEVANTSIFNPYVIVLFFLNLIIPMFEFSFKMKKRNIDQLYTLPLKREKIFFVKYLVGLIEVNLPFIIGSLISVLFIPIKPHYYNLGMFIPFFLSLMLVGVGIYTIVSCIFIYQNNEIDGVICSLLGTVILALFLFAIYSIFLVCNNKDEFPRILYPSYYLLFSPLFNVVTGFRGILCNKFNPNLDPWTYKETFSMIIFVIISIGAFILAYFHIKNDKSENAERISPSLLGYRIFIPVLAISLSCILSEAIELAIVFQIFVYFCYVLYLRTFKFSKKYIIVVPLVIAISVLSGVILHIIA